MAEPIWQRESQATGSQDLELNELYQKNFRSIARNEALQPEVRKSFFHLGRAVLLYGILLTAVALIPMGWATMPLHLLLTYGLGLTLMTFQSISHDCGHGAFFKRKAANDWVGVLTAIPLLVSYIAWSDDHRGHHGRTNHIDDDPNKYHMTQAQIEQVQAGFKKPLYFLYFWFYTAMANIQLGLIAVHLFGLPLKKGTTLYWSQERPRSAAANLVLLFGFALAVYQFSSAALLIYGFVIPYFLYHMLFIMLGYFQHNYRDSHYYDDENYSFMRGVIQSKNLDFGRLHNFFFAGFAETHLEHHLFPTVPLYKLALVKGQLDQEMQGALAQHWKARPVRFYKEFYEDYNKNYLLVKEGDYFKKAYRFGERKSFLFFLFTGTFFPLVWFATVMKAKKQAQAVEAVQPSSTSSSASLSQEGGKTAA